MAGLPERPCASSAESWPWQAVCDQAVGPLALLDVQGHYCYVNQALCDLLGYERSELVGRTTRDITPDEDPALDQSVITDAFAGPVVPPHLTTIEFQADVRRVLRPGGVHVVNVIDEPPGRIARRQATTLVAAFSEVVLMAPRAVVSGRRTGNVVFAAADRTLSLGRLRARGAHEVLGPAEVAVFADGGAVLRDR